LQQLADDRVLDAEALLNAGRWSGAYYVSGYAVECALKACIAKQTNLHDFPDKTVVQKSHAHDLT
jgi:HEPN domain-containing protein